MADNRPSVYFDETVDAMVYRASSTGSCVRALVASAMGEQEVRAKDRQELMDRSAEEGNLHEGAVTDLMKEIGWTFISTQDLVTVKVIPGVIIRGHTDGRAVAPSGFTYEGGQWSPPGDYSGVEHGVEVKSMSTKQFAKWMNQRFGAFPYYSAQITSYMEATGLPFLYAVKRREDGLLLVDRLETPPMEFKTIRQKIVLAEKYRRRNEAKRGTEYPACDTNTYGCPFFYLHDEDQPELKPDELNDDEQAIVDRLTERFLTFKETEAEGKSAESARKGVQKELLNMISGKQVRAYVNGQKFVVTRTPGGGKTFDEAKARAELGDAKVDSYMKEYSYEYLIVREEK
jgi:hypothetical protein